MTPQLQLKAALLLTYVVLCTLVVLTALDAEPASALPHAMGQ